MAQRRAGEVGAVLGYETVEPQPAAAVAPPAADFKVREAPGELAEAQGAVGTMDLSAKPAAG